MAMLAGRIKPPLQYVACDKERSRNGPITGDLPIAANVDQRCSRAHCHQGLSRKQPGQPASRRR
jgi:hypothetical protein